MTKHNISDLLDELQSKEATVRSDAIKKIILGKISDERIIHALNNVIENDPSMALRNFARSALDVFGIKHSAVEEPAAINWKSSDHNEDIPPSETLNASPVVPFWSNRKQKLWSIFATVVAVFIFTLPYSIFSLFVLPILKFPLGFVGLLNNKVDAEAFYWNEINDLFAVLVWILYIGMAIAIARSNKRKVVFSLYIILILLLILNVVGCQISGPVIMSGIE